MIWEKSFEESKKEAHDLIEGIEDRELLERVIAMAIRQAFRNGYFKASENLLNKIKKVTACKL